MRIQLDYKGAVGGKYPANFQNFFFENIRCKKTEMGLKLYGLPDKSINNVFLKDFIVDTTEKEMEVYYTNNFNFENVKRNTILADESEYFEEGYSQEEAPDRLTWADLAGDDLIVAPNGVKP